MIMNVSTSGSKLLLRSVVDIVWMLIALILASAAMAFVVIRVLEFDMSQTLAGDPRVWATLVLQPVIVLPILTVLLRRRGESWRNLGLRKPADWRRFLRQLTIAMIALVAASAAIRWPISPALNLGDTGGQLSALQGNVSASLAALAYAIFFVGLYEELLVRGFLMSRIGQGLSGGTAAWAIAAVVSGVMFGLGHYAHGAAEVLHAGLLGILLGAIYLWADRNLWVVIIAHSLFDVIRVVLLFFTGRG